jgi:hypothetical protein
VSEDKGEDKPEPGDEPSQKKPLRPGEVRLKPAGEATVKHEECAPEPPVDKRIHPRRPLPPVPEKPAEPPDEDQEP